MVACKIQVNEITVILVDYIIFLLQKSISFLEKEPTSK